MDTTTTRIHETFARRETGELSQPPPGAADKDRHIYGDVATQVHQLGIWLRALPSFFNARNHPLTEAERGGILSRDFINETRLAHHSLRFCLQLILRITQANLPPPLLQDDEEMVVGQTTALIGDDEHRSLVALSGAFNDALEICRALLDARAVSFRTWAGFGNIVTREIARSTAGRRLQNRAQHAERVALQPALHSLLEGMPSEKLSADLRLIFTGLAQLLEQLRFVEDALRRDQPLKQMLPIFTLVHEDARTLIDMIVERALPAGEAEEEEVERDISDALDGTAYAISMELRKAFEHELAGISTVRPVHQVFAKVENAHGVLRDCFQQSTVALAQICDRAVTGADLFQAFQTRLDQSLLLRRDLWILMQLVQRAERERDRRPIAPLFERLMAFREGSLRYLMYKDWESYERFLDEIAAARGAIELTPVLHRFGAYLETLFGQINMRAALSAHPFDYPAIED